VEAEARKTLSSINIFSETELNNNIAVIQQKREELEKKLKLLEGMRARMALVGKEESNSIDVL
jgi:hypothetical protein